MEQSLSYNDICLMVGKLYIEQASKVQSLESQLMDLHIKLRQLNEQLSSQSSNQ